MINRSAGGTRLLDSFQALAVALVALLPGALYVWSFERQAGRYGIRLNDRLLRFFGGSAVFVALFAVPLHAVVIRIRGPLFAGEALPLWAGLVALAYVLVPIGTGTLIGVGLRRGWRWTAVVTGPHPAPRAWDYLFQYRARGWVRCRLKSGGWLAGAYANTPERRSYASAYPEPQDLYLAVTIAVDSDSGEFLVDEQGRPLKRKGGLLLRWEEVEYLEFIDI